MLDEIECIIPVSVIERVGLVKGVAKHLTCDVQTLLNTTKHTVCTNHANGRSSLLFPNNTPVPIDSTICGPKLVSGDCTTARHIESIAEGDVTGIEAEEGGIGRPG